MRTNHRTLSSVLFPVPVLLVAVAAMLNVDSARAQWTQWGGPNRDFNVKSKKLASQWPEGGPKKVVQEIRRKTRRRFSGHG